MNPKFKLSEVVEQIPVWKEWKDYYNTYVPLFIQEAAKGLDWSQWNPDVFDVYMNKTGNHPVASLPQGHFTLNERETIKNNWSSIAPLLQKIALNQDKASFLTYNQLQAEIRKFTTQNRKASTYRMIAGLQPNLLCNVINEKSLNDLLEILNTKFGISYASNGRWFADSHYVLKVFKRELGIENGYEIMTYPWQVLQYFQEAKL